MKKFKDIIIIFSVSFLLLVGVAGTAFFGSTLIDRLTGRHEYYKKAVMLSTVSVAAESALRSKLLEYVYDNQYAELTGFAHDTGFYFILHRDNGPGINNVNPSVVERANEKVTIELTVKKSVDIVPQRVVSGNSEKWIYEEWLFLYDDNKIVYIGLLVSFIIMLLSLITLFVTSPAVYKIWFFLIVVSLLEIAFLRFYTEIISNKLLTVFLIEKIILGTILTYFAHQLTRLKRGIININEEDNEKRSCKVTSFPVTLQPLAESINNAKEKVASVIEEKTKSERLKTELISNVSHDIKTPLTSIINFSDLIFHEDTENEKIKDYSKRLYDQSIHMKGLMDSLIEASKASAGAVEINLEPCGIDTLIEQCVIEYEEKLKQNKIELVTELPNEQLSVKVDAKAMSRVIDNLLTNICKYSMPDSRAYITANTTGDKVIIRFRNTSAEPINISPDELTERFVRGDLSRHSEGHGLGLSIVKSLVELMDGETEISARYDIFEVSLIFDKVEVTNLEVAG